MKTDVSFECSMGLESRLQPVQRNEARLDADFAKHEPAEAGTPKSRRTPKRPRLGFVGVGWIGRNRLETIAKSGLAEVVAIADASSQLASKAAESAPEAAIIESMDELFELEMDGVVIATPSALHAAQATAALEHGLAVFCQKPLGRNGRETKQVIDAARKANRLLGVDLSYR